MLFLHFNLWCWGGEERREGKEEGAGRRGGEGGTGKRGERDLPGKHYLIPARL